MIIYFSGTGNSEYVAKRIGKELPDEVVNLFEKIRSQDYSGLSSDTPWIVVAPTYAWRIPRILHEWLKQTDLNGSKEIYFVMTCDGSNGNAGLYLEKLCQAKGMHYRGCISVNMPENYIALFHSPEKEEALAKIEQSEPRISSIIEYLKNNQDFPRPHAAFMDKLNSGLINDLFYPLFVHSKKFYVTEGCISCGKCKTLCPLNNIEIKDGKPVWGNSCTHCMACICRCPTNAIEYGSHSKGLLRYVCPKE